MLTRTEVVSAAALWVRERLRGPVRDAAVVHAGADAIYVDADGDCIGVLSRFATPVPCGLRTTLPTLEGLLPDTATASIGDDRLSMAAVDVRVTRFVDIAAPALRPSPRTLSRLLATADTRLSNLRDALPPQALEELRRGSHTVVPVLLGHGDGLTPLGDDVLCGWLATRLSLGEPIAAVAAAVDALAPRATTLLSATLLRRAADGDVLPEFRRLLIALSDPEPAAVDGAVAELVAVGHTSGAGMLLGATLALGRY